MSNSPESAAALTEWRRDGYVITTDQTRFDFAAIWEFLTDSYWSPGISRDAVVRGTANSLAFGLLTDAGQQAGFARMTTDYTSIAWLADVFVLEQHRGRGLGKWLVGIAVGHPYVVRLRLILATRDAHGLYAQFGFEPADPQRIMQRPRPG